MGELSPLLPEIHCSLQLGGNTSPTCYIATSCPGWPACRAFRSRQSVSWVLGCLGRRGLQSVVLSHLSVTMINNSSTQGKGESNSSINPIPRTLPCVSPLHESGSFWTPRLLSHPHRAHNACSTPPQLSETGSTRASDRRPRPAEHGNSVCSQAL